MIVLQRLIALIFICNFLIYSPTSLAITPIHSIEEVEKKVKVLLGKGVKPEKICVVFDFHGVVVEEPIHTPPFRLKGNIKDTLTYLQKEEVPYLIATAWSDFNAVIRDGIIPLGLQDHVDVKPHNVSLNTFELGVEQETFEGYQNGKVIALKKADSGSQFFFNKAYTVEAVYPDNKFQYIIGVDDSERYLQIFQEDSYYITPSSNPKFVQLILFHLVKP